MIDDAMKVVEEVLASTTIDKVPKTDAEKIEWLWKVREKDHQTIADLQEALKRKDVQLSRISTDNRALQRRVDELTRERDAWAIELNAANQRAVNAVEEYLRLREG